MFSFLQGNRLFVQAFNMLLWLITIGILSCIIVVPFLHIDKQFNITPGLSLSNVIQAFDPALLSALYNSVCLSILASLFSILCGSLLAPWLEKKAFYLGGFLVLVYCINPVARALSYFDLFQLYTPLYDWSNWVFGEGFTKRILFPSIILGIHYFPIYVMRLLFVLRKKNIAQETSGILDLLFVKMPPWIRGFPISFALFFLLSFFDYWVIQVTSGNTVLYWSPLFVQKAFTARDMGQAALMISIGLLTTLIAYLGALILSQTLRWGWRKLSPLRFRAQKTQSPIFPWIQSGISFICLFLVSWPLWGSLIKLFQIILRGENLSLIPEFSHALLTTLLLGIAVGGVASTGGLILSAFHQERPRLCRWWLPSLYLLALAPEAAYVLLSLFVTGAGFLQSSAFWLFLLIISYCIPISFFLWESLWGEMEELKLWLLGGGMQNHIFRNTYLAIKEWKRPWGLIFIVSFWLTIDDVFLANFATDPKWKPVSVILFNSTKRGYDTPEFLSGIVTAVAVFAIMVGVYFLFNQKTSHE